MSTRIIRAAVTALVLGCAVALALGDVTALGATPIRARGAYSARAAIGLDTSAALRNAHCDRATRRIKYASRYRPPCVRPFAAGSSNGGASSMGVSATAIKVVVLVPSDQQSTALAAPFALPTNQATRQVGTFGDAVRDASAVFDYAGFETWGRSLEVTLVTSVGNDDAAQRADAAAVIAQQPFAVIVPLPSLTGGIGGPVFERAVAERKIVVIGYPTTREALAQQPYRWSVSIGDDWAPMYLTAEFVGEELSGRRAVNAGDDALRSRERVFGIVLPAGATALDARRVRAAITAHANGPTHVVAATYDPTLASSDPTAFYQDVVPGITARLQAEGVTTIVPFTDSATINGLMKAATNLGYEPEWVSTTYGGASSAGSTRSWDQQQASRFFGLQSGVVPVLAPATTQPLQGFQWYWGTNLGTSMGSVTSSLELLRTGVHLAGPRLTPATYAAGICEMGALGGAADGTQSTMRAPCRAAGLPYAVHHSGALDASLGWWDTTATYTTATGATIGPGAWRFLDEGRRYHGGTVPRSAQPFFDATKATVAYPEPRARDALPTYPCDNCPGGQSATLTADATPAAPSDTQLHAAAASGAVLAEDFADPFVLEDAGVYYAYSTGGARGIVQVARSSDLTHWTWSGAALATVPQWATGRAVWAPSVLRLGDEFVMHYAARDRATGQWCLAVAVAPHPNAVFVDASATPFLCQADRGGSIDPYAFVDRDGTPYLLWKSQSAAGAPPSVLFGAQLTADGRGIVSGSARVLLTTASAWEGDIIENPAMVLGSDGYTLLYSGNSYETDRYAVGLARCAGPLGPCTRTSESAAIASSGSVLGPGGATPVIGPDGVRYILFHAWAAPRVGYRAGGARSLHLRPLESLGLASR